MQSSRWAQPNQVLLAKIAASTFTLHGQSLSKEVADTFTVIFAICLCMWSDILARWGLRSIVDFDTEVGRVLNNTDPRSKSIETIFGSLDVCVDLLINNIQNEVSICWANFKHKLRMEHMLALWPSLLKPLFDHVDGLDFESQIHGIRDLYQALVFPLRANPRLWAKPIGRRKLIKLLQTKWDDSELRALLFDQRMNNSFVAKFLDEDRQLQEIEASYEISHVWFSLLYDFVDTGVPIPSYYFTFGSGATAETKRGVSRPEKWDQLISCFPWRIAYEITQVTCTDWLAPSPQLPITLDMSLWDDMAHPARLTPVPKQWNKPRLISVEPLAKNLLQMGIGNALVDFLRHTRLRDHYIPDDQSWNAAAALIGSFSGEFATIDLSSASDSVTTYFINSATRSLPVLRHLLNEARSPYVEYSYHAGSATYTRTYKLKKFAGMGNRCTFPVEVLVFSSIVIESIRLNSPDEDPYSVCWYVYGDDIVVPARLASEVIERLTHYGFRVNLAKTFIGVDHHIFRESCGTFGLDGEDITPCRLSRKLKQYKSERVYQPHYGRFTSNWAPSYISIANALYRKGCWRARSLILDLLQTGLSQEEWPVFTDDPDVGLLSSQPTNFEKKTYKHPSCRFNPKDDPRIYPDSRLFYSGRSVTLILEHLSQVKEMSCYEICLLEIAGAADEKRDVAYKVARWPRYKECYSLLYEVLRCMEQAQPSRTEGSLPYRIGDALPSDGQGGADVSKSIVVWRPGVTSTG